jgi:uncharacterized membrane protein HdeD (DUF308 family)
MPVPAARAPRLALVHALANRPTLAVLVGALLLVAGLGALSYPLLVAAVSVKVLGILFLATAFLHAFLLPASREWTGVVWHLLGVFLYAIAGLVIFRDPMGSLKLVTLLLGILFFVGGFGRIGFAFALRGAPGWSLALFSGVVSVVLGMLIVFEWPASSYWAVGTLVAVDVIVSGATLVALGLAGGRGPAPEAQA